MRGAFLDEACGGDGELRREVDRLLAAHDAAGEFLSTSIGLDSDGAEEAGALEAGPQRIGPYQILDTIAHGGMGTVYRAVRDDDAFRKTVALKLVRGGRQSDYFQRRFRQERQILARFQHPNVATVLDGGTTEDGQPYLVMEYVEGQPITDFCAAQGMGTRERLVLFRTVCGAVQYAHQNLVVHRDIKPANVLVDGHGAAKLLDFGIAKLLASGVEPELAPTATVLPMMTPEYASPEQVKGQPVTTASDVYSLGVLLYELLAGRRPYEVQADSLEAIVQAVCQTEPKAPSEAVTERSGTTRPAGTLPPASELRGDLDTIVLKALRKEPERRYRTAHELSEDLRRHLEGLPVTARADTIGYRAGKFVRRHRTAVAAAFLVSASLVVGIVTTTRQARLAQRRFDEARRLIHTVIFDIQPKMGAVAGTTPLRKELIESTLQYLEALARDAGDNPALLRELSASYVQLARVQGLAGRGQRGGRPGRPPDAGGGAEARRAAVEAGPQRTRVPARGGVAWSATSPSASSTRRRTRRRSSMPGGPSSWPSARWRSGPTSRRGKTWPTPTARSPTARTPPRPSAAAGRSTNRSCSRSRTSRGYCGTCPRSTSTSPASTTGRTSTGPASTSSARPVRSTRSCWPPTPRTPRRRWTSPSP